MFQESICRLKCYLLLKLPFETLIVLYFQKTFGTLENWRLEIKKVTWIEKWEHFSEINFCELLFSKGFRDTLLLKTTKITKFTKVSLAKVSLIKVHLSWASQSKHLLLSLLLIFIVIIFFIANIVIKGWPSQHVINLKSVLIWCMIRLSS